MELLKSKQDLNRTKAKFKARNAAYALVPTMGALHEGHLSLMRRAYAEYDQVIVSIFVNPTQFNDASDLDRYPRELDKDLKKIGGVNKEALVFAPDVASIYPDGLKTKSYDLDGLDRVMEGRYRKGHFDGVCTVVEALFRLIDPEAAYFGEKDFQQLQIIRQMVRNRSLPVKIVGCPIVREPSGLALSSRNALLPQDSKRQAAKIYQILKTARSKFGTKSATKVADWVRREISHFPGLELEYFEIAEEESLLPVKRKQKNKKYRAFIAVYVSGIRLIDNIALE